MIMSPSRLRQSNRERMGALVTFLTIGVGILLLIPQAEAIFHEKGPTLLEIRPRETETIPEETVDKIRGFQNISRIERYLLIKTKPHDVIGIEPGA
ncbi:MAG: hypothetical protein IH857_03470, partial [Deltaproteobacteria bacterium]|nr:hypothetical protein [Deltaproteobacteria bacterium]